MCNEAKKMKKFVMQVPKCGVEPAGWEVTFYNGGSGNQNQGTVTKATAKTYDFVGLTISDFAEGSLTAKDDGAALTALADGADNYIKTKTEVSVKGATLYGGKNNLRVRAESAASTAINYNGGEANDISSGITVANLSRWIKIPVDGAGTVTASVKFVNSSKNTGTLQAGLFSAEGKLLGSLVTADVATGKITDTDSNTGTISATTTVATDVYLVLSRNGASGGGMDVYSITVTPAE